MRFRGSLVALGVLAALGAYLYFVEFPRQEKKAETEKREKQVFSFSRDDVVKVTVKKRGEADIVVSRIENESDSLWTWRMEAPVETYADRVRVEDILRELETLRKERTLESTNPAAYGLDPPEVFVEAALRNGDTISLALGADTPVENHTYARIGGGEIILVDRYAKTSLAKDSLALRERRAAPFDFMRLTRIEARREKDVVTAEKRGNRWHITAPIASPAEKDRVENFLHALETMQASAVVAEHADAATLKRLGLDRPFLTVTLTELRGGEARRVEAAFAEKDGKLRALRGFDGAALEIENPRREDLNVSFEAWRRRKVFALPKWDIKKIEVKAEAGGWTLVKENWEWRFAEPKKDKPDRLKADDVASTAARLAATAFLSDCGEGAPFLELRVSGDDTTEVAAFRRTSDGKICARVEGWDAALAVDEAALDVFLKSAEHLMEPSPPPAWDDHHGHGH